MDKINKNVEKDLSNYSNSNNISNTRGFKFISFFMIINNIILNNI